MSHLGNELGLVVKWISGDDGGVFWLVVVMETFVWILDLVVMTIVSFLEIFEGM